MAKSIKPEDLSAAIGRELGIYGQAVQSGVDACGRRAMRDLVKRTQETAPLGKRRGGNFVTSITSKEVKRPTGSRFIWYVKAPNHRLTHLLVHGHAKVNGGRVPGHPFLKNALNEVLPKYEHDVEEAIKNDR